MIVQIDVDECCGHGRCEEVAPELFEVRDDNLAHLLVREPDDSHKARLELAARTCPARAISVQT